MFALRMNIGLRVVPVPDVVQRREGWSSRI